MKHRFENLLGKDKVVSDRSLLASYGDSFEELEQVIPALVVLPTSVEEVQAIVRVCADSHTAIAPRIGGAAIGAFAVHPNNSLVMDLRCMDSIVDVFVDDQVAVLEPGVTQDQLLRHLDARELRLTFGVSFGTGRSSVLASCLFGGSRSLSIKWGAMSQSVSGLEVVLSDGSIARTGAWAVSDTPFVRDALPDLTGLFLGWQATYGIITKFGFRLAPRHPHSARLIVLAYSLRGTLEAVRCLRRMECYDDIGAISSAAAKMMLGVDRPRPASDPSGPQFMLFVEMTAELPEQLVLQRQMLGDVIRKLRAQGECFEEPIDVQTLAALNPALNAFASLPADPDFSIDPSSRCMAWLGTYGPISRIEDAASAGMDAMRAHGMAPTFVARSMQRGHFGALRFLCSFDRDDPGDVASVRAMNAVLLRGQSACGFVVSGASPWVVREMVRTGDKGTVSLLERVKEALGPSGLFDAGVREGVRR